MIRDDQVIDEINALWTPVYPFLAEHLLGVSGLGEGAVLDLGPFAGGIALSLLAAREGLRATVQDEEEGVLRWTRARAAGLGLGDRLRTVRAALEPIPAADASYDLVAVRGAFFFLTPSLLREVRRVLRPGAFAWVGGGYGPTTPPAVIEPIAERSKLLNEAVGKRRISEAEAGGLVAGAGLEGCTRVSVQGGLWIEIRS